MSSVTTSIMLSVQFSSCSRACLVYSDGHTERSNNECHETHMRTILVLSDRNTDRHRVSRRPESKSWLVEATTNVTRLFRSAYMTKARPLQTKTLARASAPALAMKALVGWKATSKMLSSNFFLCAVISCTHCLLSNCHSRMLQS